MLSIDNVKAVQASSYYSKDGYYVRLKNNQDHWFGSLKENLGLPDNVTREDFNELINEHKERAGYDLCFSAPKSVSVAMILDDKTRQDMIDSHNKAVKSILEQIEQREIGTRIKKNGIKEHIKTGNMLAGCFNHYVSRNSDPQLHTHAVILNKTKYNDKYYTVDNPDLYKNKILYGQLYRNALTKELMSKGYEVTVTDVAKGFFELKGVDEAAIAQFSSRRKEIVEKMKEWNAHSAQAASQAAIMTRKAKANKDMGILMQSWQETLKEIGGATVTKSPSPITLKSDQQKEEFKQAVNRLERQSFAFTEKELKKAVLASGVGSGMNENEYENLKTEAGEFLITLGCTKDSENGEIYYTTKRNLETEKKIFAEVKQTSNFMQGLNSEETNEFLTAALEKENTSLSEQQRNAVISIATTTDQYSAVQGLAGTGKTHMLNYARQVLQNSGYEVSGACFTGKAAAGLEADAHIPSSTIHSFLNKLEREAGNASPSDDMQAKTSWNLKGLKLGTKKEAWVVDEASMVDNTVMYHLMLAAKAKHAKVVFVGDRQQLLPVGVGNAFSAMTENEIINTVRLDEIRRQKNAELLRGVQESVIGDIENSFEILEKDTHVIEKHNKRIKAIVADYIILDEAARQKTVVLTAGNRDRQLINEYIRARLKKKGCIPDGKEFKVSNASGKTYIREFSVKDKVIFLQNDNKLNVRNGQTGFVSEVNDETITVKSGDKEIIINLDDYNKIDHGYALTTHKAQGITEDRALINLDSSQRQLNSRNSFYVDISRARYEVKIYVDDKDKIKKQVSDFAKKITSEDFRISETSESADNLKLDEKQKNDDFKKDFAINNSQISLGTTAKTSPSSSSPGMRRT